MWGNLRHSPQTGPIFTRWNEKSPLGLLLGGLIYLPGLLLDGRRIEGRFHAVPPQHVRIAFIALRGSGRLLAKCIFRVEDTFQRRCGCTTGGNLPKPCTHKGGNRG